MKWSIRESVILFGVLFLAAALILASPVLFHPEKKYEIHGLDISHHQGAINWQELSKSVKSGPFAHVKFVYIKVTEGTTWIDRLYEDHWQGAGTAGLDRGAYHFYSLKFSGLEQAQHFVKEINKFKWEIPPVVDLEFSGNSRYRPSQTEFNYELVQFLSTVEAATGRRPLIYTTHFFYRRYLKEHFDEEQYWIRDIHFSPGKWRSPDWLLWQYEDRGRIPGIEGDVDFNLYRHTSQSYGEWIQ